MSYQIKSTPYFRRMFNNSKKNGQLQRLREEYERIQEFNDRTIELKMRQVRLKRLFREIEELKEGSGGSSNTAAGGAGGGSSPSPTAVIQSTRRRHHQQQQQQPPHGHHHHQNLQSAGITPEQRRHHQRAEALIRSRELGKELSRRNAQMAEAGMGGGGGGYLRPDLRTSAKMRAVADSRRDAQERRERAAKRISYGNDQSRQNLQRQLKVCKRRLMAKYQPAHGTRELGPNEFRPDYRHITPSQLDMMVDEEEMAEEQQRYFREQEEDELQLAEERFRRQEKRLRLEAAGSSITSEEDEEDGQEELRFLRGEQALSGLEDEEECENAMELSRRRRRHNLKRPAAQERFGGDRTYSLTLAEEHFRLVTGYSDEERQQDQEEDEDEAPQQQVDETEAEEEEQQWGRRLRLRQTTSLLPLHRFSLSSTAIDTAPSAVSQDDPHHHQYRGCYHPISTEAGAYSSDQEMRTAPLANEELLMTSIVPPRSLKCPTASETDDVPALNNWRRVSLLMPWFKAFSPPRQSSLSDRSLDGTLQQLPLREGGAAAELLEPSMIGDNL